MKKNKHKYSDAANRDRDGKSTAEKKNWRIWNWSYIMLNRVTQTARHCELLKKTYFSINQMHHDPIWLDPQLRRKPNYNRIDIVLFSVGFLCFTHSNGKWQSVRISWGLRSMGKFHRNKNQKTQLKAFNMNGFCVHSKKIAFVFDATKSKIALQFSIAATSSIGSGRLITWHRTRLHMSKLLLQFSVGRISPGSSNNDVNKMLNNRKVT